MIFFFVMDTKKPFIKKFCWSFAKYKVLFKPNELTMSWLQGK